MAARVFCVLWGYLCGSFLTAELLLRLKTGTGSRESGFGNPGTANATARFGAKFGGLVLLGDVMKTALACLVCRMWIAPELGAPALVFATLGAALGHNWPFWNGFHGGKGVAVTVAGTVFAAPFCGLICALLGALCALFSGYLALGTLTIALALPVAAVFLKAGAETAVVFGLLGALMVWRHRENFSRIRAGKEKKLMVFKAR